MSSTRTTTSVVGLHVLQTIVAAENAPESVRLTVRVDYAREWSFEEPGWRELGYGATDTWAYVWSARHLIALQPDDTESDPLEIRTDEDIVMVFVVGRRWLLICETSLRLFDGAEPVARVESGEVVAEARWEEGQLLIHDLGGGLTRVRIANGGLEVEP